MFELHVLPGEHGDCLLLSWGDDAARHHLLIDAGPVDGEVQAALEERLEQLGVAGTGRLELLVVTHIDADHVGGVTRLLGGDLPCEIGDVWFNGYDHLSSDELGVAQAERLTDQIIAHRLDWNGAFGRRAVMVPTDEEAPLPQVELPGGLRLTVLGPTQDRLTALIDKWETYCAEAGLVPGVDPAVPEAADELGDSERVDLDDLNELAEWPFTADPSKPNASSICLLAEHEGHTVLLTGDALEGDVVAGLARLNRHREEPVSIGTLKLPHHGSRANVSEDLVETVAARRYVVSSSGRQFKHPHAEAIARILVSSRRGVELCFNYRSEESLRWDVDDLRDQHGYRTVFPEEDQAGLVIDLTTTSA